MDDQIQYMNWLDQDKEIESLKMERIVKQDKEIESLKNKLEIQSAATERAIKRGDEWKRRARVYYDGSTAWSSALPTEAFDWFD